MGFNTQMNRPYTEEPSSVNWGKVGLYAGGGLAAYGMGRSLYSKASPKVKNILGIQSQGWKKFEDMGGDHGPALAAAMKERQAQIKGLRKQSREFLKDPHAGTRQLNEARYKFANASSNRSYGRATRRLQREEEKLAKMASDPRSLSGGSHGAKYAEQIKIRDAAQEAVNAFAQNNPHVAPGGRQFEIGRAHV